MERKNFICVKKGKILVKDIKGLEDIYDL